MSYRLVKVLSESIQLFQRLHETDKRGSKNNGIFKTISTYCVYIRVYLVKSFYFVIFICVGTYMWHIYGGGGAVISKARQIKYSF